MNNSHLRRHIVRQVLSIDYWLFADCVTICGYFIGVLWKLQSVNCHLIHKVNKCQPEMNNIQTL